MIGRRLLEVVDKDRKEILERHCSILMSPRGKVYHDQRVDASMTGMLRRSAAQHDIIRKIKTTEIIPALWFYGFPFL